MQQQSEEIISLIDEIEQEIEEANPYFLNKSQKLIEPDVLLEILDEIRDRFPQEFTDAKRIIKEQNEIMNVAQQQAQQIIADAQQQAMIIAGDQEVVRLAQQQADDIRNQAQAYERDTRYNAEAYAESVLTHLEDNLKSITAQVARVRQTLDDNSDAGKNPNSGAW